MCIRDRVNSHDFDTLRWYADSEVKSIHAIGRNFRSCEKKAEYPDYYDTVAVLLEFENGIIGMIDGAQYVQYGYCLQNMAPSPFAIGSR